MKKVLVIVMAALLALSLAACGGNEQNQGGATTEAPTVTEAPQETPQEETQEVPGTYANVSLFLTSTYQLNENGSFDKTSPEEKGTYTVGDDGSIELTEAGMSGGDIFTPYGQYYYRSNLICCFEEDEEYGMAPSFDENGRSNQTFEAYYERTDTGNQRYVEFTMNEDGTFVLKRQIHNLDGILSVVDYGLTFEGTYALDGDILTLNWNGIEVPFLLIDEKIYFDVIVKQTDENMQAFTELNETLAAAEEARFAPVDETLAGEISALLQGSWEYTSGQVSYDIYFEGENINVTSTVSGYTLENQGTYVICSDFILVNYQNGGQAIMQYTYENGQLSLYPLYGLES